VRVSAEVDDVGYIPFDPEAANLMFSLVSSRYERGSMIVTSNKPFSAWGESYALDDGRRLASTTVAQSPRRERGCFRYGTTFERPSNTISPTTLTWHPRAHSSSARAGVGQRSPHYAFTSPDARLRRCSSASFRRQDGAASTSRSLNATGCNCG
jgi:hypothetical protein